MFLILSSECSLFLVRWTCLGARRAPHVRRRGCCDVRNWWLRWWTVL